MDDRTVEGQYGQWLHRAPAKDPDAMVPACSGQDLAVRPDLDISNAWVGDLLSSAHLWAQENQRALSVAL